MEVKCLKTCYQPMAKGGRPQLFEEGAVYDLPEDFPAKQFFAWPLQQRIDDLFKPRGRKRKA